MRIKRAHIYGFGKWVDHMIQFPEQRFLCLYGENESGKSTLQHFFMFMLFGFPPKKRTFYYPKTSSRMGGQLTIEDEQIGVYTIERIDGIKNGAAKCLLPNGEERDETWLQKQLHGMTASIYEAVFSFSAHDLVAIKHMKDEDLGEILLNIGLTGYSNIYEIEKQLNRELDQLFKPYGTRPKMNEQLNLLEEQSEKLTEMKNKIALYREQREQYGKIQNELEQLHAQLKTKEKVHRQIEKKLNNLNTIVSYFSYKRQLDQLPDDISFPERGIERLQAIQEQLLPIKGEQSVMQEHERNLIASLEKARMQLLEKSTFEEAKVLSKRERIFYRNEDDLVHVKERIKKLQTQIENELNRLQIDLQKEEIAHLTFPFHLEHQWNEYNQQDKNIKLDREYLSEQYDAILKQNEVLDKERDQLQDHTLTEKQKQIYINQLNDYNIFYEQKQLQQDQIEQREKWNKLREKKKREQTIILVSSLLLALLSIGIGYSFEDGTFYYIAIIAIGIGMSHRVFSHFSLRETKQLLQLHKKDLAQKPMVTEREKEEIENLLIKDKEAKTSLQAIENDLRQNQLELLEIDNKRTTLDKEENKLTKQIAEQKTQYPFLHNVKVKYWPEIFHTVRHLSEMAKEVKELLGQKEYMKDKQLKINKQLTTFIKKLEGKDQKWPSIEMFERLNAKIIQHENGLESIDHYEMKLEQNKQKQRNLTKKMTVFQKEIDQLFAFAAVESVEAFYKKAEAFSEQQKIKTNLKKLKEQLNIVYSAVEFEQLANTSLDEQELKMEKQKVSKEIQHINERMSDKREEEARLYAILLKLESSEAHSEAMHRFAMEKERLHELALDWSVFTTAREILSETKRLYQMTYLAKVIDQTTTYFKEITNGTYVRIFPPKDEHPFQVECTDGIRYTVNELSQGTIDQLYIALRIAMGEMISEQHHIPFIIDDAFVHFDSSRLERMIKIVKSISKNNQVIIFTCRQEIVNSLEKYNVVHLDHLPTVRIK